MHLFGGLLHFQNADNLQCYLDSSSQTNPARLTVCCCSPVALVDPNPKQKEFGELAQGKLHEKENLGRTWGFSVIPTSNFSVHKHVCIGRYMVKRAD